MVKLFLFFKLKIMTYFDHKHVLEAKQFSRKDLEVIFLESERMEKIICGKEKWDLLSWKIVASLFYEPSTRTRLSFETAAKRLWAEVITVTGSGITSLSKWETLEDNAKIMEIYSDLIVMRHPETGSVARTAKVVNKPVLNAWDWAGEHPTQALLDVYTILKERKKLDNLKISIVWDLKYWRTTHSLVFLMWLFNNIEFNFISPSELKMPKKVIDFLEEKNIKYTEFTDYKEGIKNSDVLYVTRIQKERLEGIIEYEKIKNDFILTPEILDWNTDITIMHPLPRVNEVSPEIDKMPNAAFFRQAKNGVPIRMALLYLLLISHKYCEE